jgi:hypothetical protein
VGGVGLFDTGFNGVLKIIKISVVLGIQTLITDKLPEPLNQIQMG